MTDEQGRFMAACEKFGIPCRREGEHFVIMDEDVERRVVLCPETEEETNAVSPCDVVIENEAQLDDFEGGNLEVVLRPTTCPALTGREGSRGRPKKGGDRVADDGTRYRMGNKIYTYDELRAEAEDDLAQLRIAVENEGGEWEGPALNFDDYVTESVHTGTIEVVGEHEDDGGM